MAQTLLPPAHDPYDKDADEHPYHNTAPHDDNQQSGDSSNPAAYDPQKTPLMDGSDPTAVANVAKQEAEGDNGDSSDTEGDTPGRTKSAEEDGDEGGLLNEDGDDDLNAFQRGRAKVNLTKGRLSKMAGNKLLIGGAIGGGAGVAIVLILLVLIAGSLKIPNLAEHITSYEFARVMRQSVETDGKITNEKFAVDSLTQQGADKVKADYERLRGNTWGKFDKYRPAKVIANMKGEGDLKPKYSTPNVFGRQQLESVTLNNETFDIAHQGASRFIPGFSQVIKFKRDFNFAKNYSPALSQSLKDGDKGTVIRGLVGNTTRKELGIGLIAWHVGDYKGKSAEKARLIQERAANKAVADPKVDVPETGPLKDAVNDGKAAEQKAIDNDAQLTEAVKNGGVAPEVEKAIENDVVGNNFQKILSFANPSYGLAMGGCIIYDGSLTQSGPTINALSDSQERLYYYINSAGDQEKSGDTTGEAVGALDSKLGDITLSNAEVRAANGHVDTSSSISSQASAGGDFSILDAVLGSGPASTIGNVVGKGVCPALTNTYVAVGGAVVLTALTFLTGGSVAAADAAAESAIEAGTAGLTERLFVGAITKFGSEEAAQKAGAITGKAAFIAKDTAISGAKLAGLTILAKLIVMNRMHSTTNGLEQGTELANAADSGGNQTANVFEQRQFYGRPLTTSEVFETKSADAAFTKSQEQAKPAAERYFALSNPNSLLNKVASTTASTLNHSFFASLLKLGTKLFNPVSSLNSLFGSAFMPKSAEAATSSLASSDYGNVQWGYSNREMNILRLDFTFRPLENKSLLDQSGEEDDIEAKYTTCFDGSKKIGDMLAEGMLVRDKSGNVDPDKGLCAPNHLAYDSTDPDFQPHMVFRWRVAHNYDNGLDQLLDQQEVQASTAAGTVGPSVVGQSDISDVPQVVANQILANNNISYIYSAREDVKDIADGGTFGTNGVPIDIRALQVVAALGKKHKIIVSAYESHGQGHSTGSDHYTGHAVDIATIDGQVANKNITDFYADIAQYTTRAVFLQGDCPGAKAAPAGMMRKDGDDCSHQHISFN